MILLAACQSTLSHFLQSPSTPPHSASRPPSHTGFLYQHLPLESRHPAMRSMTAPHIECYPMATARLLYMPAAHARSAWCTLSLSHVTPYYRKTHMRSLCELAALDVAYKRLSWTKRHVGTTSERSQADSKLDSVVQSVLMQTELKVQSVTCPECRRHSGPLCIYEAPPLTECKQFLCGKGTVEISCDAQSHISNTVYWQTV